MGKVRAQESQKLEELDKRVTNLETPKSQTEPVVTDQIKGQLAAMPIDAALVALVLAAFPALPASVAVAVVVVLTHVTASILAAYTARQKVVPTVKL